MKISTHCVTWTNGGGFARSSGYLHVSVPQLVPPRQVLGRRESRQSGKFPGFPNHFGIASHSLELVIGFSQAGSSMTATRGISLRLNLMEIDPTFMLNHLGHVFIIEDFKPACDTWRRVRMSCRCPVLPIHRGHQCEHFRVREMHPDAHSCTRRKRPKIPVAVVRFRDQRSRW